VLANGLFAGAEIAIVSVRRTRLRELAAAGSRAAHAVETLRASPERFLATVQIGITVVGTTAAAFGGASLALRLEGALANVPLLAPHAEAVAVTLVVAAVSYLSLVLGELVPKSLALRSAERFALRAGRPLLVLAQAARPLVWFLTASSNLVLRAFGDRTSFTEARLSPDELRQLVRDTAQAGDIDARAGEIATRALDFGQLRAVDVMVPRGAIHALARRAGEDEIRSVVLEERHDRLPVYDGTLDNVVGYVVTRDLLAVAWQGGLVVLEDLLRPAWFVHSGMRAVDLLHGMRARRQPLAMVVDESGGLKGLVTLEDLLEELVGEMFSEHAAAESPVRREPDGSLRVGGGALVRELNREHALALPESPAWTTVAGLCIALTGAIPGRGACVTIPGGTVLEVLEASPRRVLTVRIRTKDEG